MSRPCLKKTRTGRPCGDDSFVERMEEMTGRILKPQKPGPKTEDEKAGAANSAPSPNSRTAEKDQRRKV